MEDFLEGDKITLIKMCETVTQGETLNNLKSQIKGDFDTLVVEIASPGGSVSEGLEIMLWLNKLMNEGKFVITIVTANAYSIASLIMLAANMRIISTHGKVMVHNPMIPELKYANANDLEKYIDELRSLESVMYELYSSFTGMSYDEIKILMDNETYLNPQEAVKSGFADREFEINPRPYVTANHKNETNMSKTVNALNRVMALVNNSDVVNQIYYDMDGGKVEIYQMKSATYSKGDKTNIKEGVKKIADGSVLTIENFVITDINKEDIVQTNTEKQAVANDDSKEGAEDLGAVNVDEQSDDEDTSNEGQEDSDSEGDESNENEDSEDVEDESKEDDKPNIFEALEAMEARILETVETKTAEMKAEYDAKIGELKVFENLATETIESIVKNTSTNFKPEARATSKQSAEGISIFRKSLIDAGIGK